MLTIIHEWTCAHCQLKKTLEIIYGTDPIKIPDNWMLVTCSEGFAEMFCDNCKPEIVKKIFNADISNESKDSI